MKFEKRTKEKGQTRRAGGLIPRADLGNGNHNENNQSDGVSRAGGGSGAPSERNGGNWERQRTM